VAIEQNNAKTNQKGAAAVLALGEILSIVVDGWF
jgi:hypothetical protein